MDCVWTVIVIGLLAAALWGAKWLAKKLSDLIWGDL